ncbi:nonstructural S protein [Arumowot virus]|uniref:Nonstructural S protein n=1 Tax=Arumowot virus TaxID=904698 RepID=I1SV57_9VIRU|nr:nonstructural protein [Arumowot virus]YP_010839688.1 nonstructural S protein [Arumowot virus]AEF30502.1 nonstructural protein [Arumowot virus]ATE88459.1 nonstructural S protein [Arumowot virus]
MASPYNYIHDLVTPNYNGPIPGEVVVSFEPVNSYVNNPVCVYEDLEFEISGMGLCTMTSESLYDFLDSGLMPWRWGKGMFESRLTAMETPLFDSFLKQIPMIPTTQLFSVGRDPLRAALSWPTGRCSLRFFRQQWGSDAMSYQSNRKLRARLLFQSTQSSDLETAIITLAKDIRGMSSILDFPLNLIPGFDLLKCVSILQFIRALRSYPETEAERQSNGLRDDLDIFLGSAREALSRDFPALIPAITPESDDSLWDSGSSCEDDVDV